MKRIFTIVWTFALLQTYLLAVDYSFQKNGIYYKILSDNSVSVYGKVYGSSTANRDAYVGNVSIPQLVTYLGNDYDVIAIAPWAFAGCSSVTSIEIPQSITSIGEYAFYDCSSLISISIPNGVSEIGNAFHGCTSLTDFIIEDGDSPISIGYCRVSSTETPRERYYGFLTYSPLKSIYIGRNINYRIYNYVSVSINGKYEGNDWRGAAFENQNFLETVQFGSKVTQIGNYEFYGCKNLKKIILPHNLVSIGDYAFAGCPIKEVTLPETIKSIGANCFEECNSLTSDAIVPPDGDITADVKMVPRFSLELYRNKWRGNIYPIVDGLAFTEKVNSGSFLSMLYGINRNEMKTIAFYQGFDESLTKTMITENMNPNCLYLVPSNSIEIDVNSIDFENSNSTKVELENAYNYDCPLMFFVNDIELTYTPTVWADGQSGWDVITLPFEPTSIEASVSGSIVPITTNSKGNFWLRQYVGSSDDAVYFASTSDGVMKANTPYLIAFPGDKMGKGSLEGQTITFKAKNVTVPVTEIPSIQKNGYTFVGNYDKTADEGGGWTLNAEGSAFVWSETVGDKPFSGYFKGEAPVAGASALRMSFGQMDNATGLEQNMAELIDCADEAVYTLDGRKIIAKDLKPGLYIKNNKKMMVR